MTNPFDGTSEDLYDAAAEVHFLPTMDGGLKHGLQSGTWAHIHYGNANWHVWLHFRDAPWIFPGESHIVFLRFLDPLAHLGNIDLGMPFVLKVAGPPFAYGKITAVLQLEQHAGNELTSLDGQ